VTPGRGTLRRAGLLVLLALSTFAAGHGDLALRPLALVRAAEAQAPTQPPTGPVRYAILAESSEARYRVREQLVGVSFPNDAVGATRAIEGTIVLDGQGRVVPADSRITIDLRTLKSDEARRDNYLRRRTLETDRFPTVTFVPAEVRRLPVPVPASGSATVEIVGDLTVRDVTRRVTWEGTATFQGQRIALRAKTTFKFGDLGLTIPRVSVVLSVEDHIQLEADLTLAAQRPV
jgi:polyisoprenoid-binding protein YceI